MKIWSYNISPGGRLLCVESIVRAKVDKATLKENRISYNINNCFKTR